MVSFVLYNAAELHGNLAWKSPFHMKYKLIQRSTALSFQSYEKQKQKQNNLTSKFL